MRKSFFKKLNFYEPNLNTSNLIKIGPASQLLSVSIDTLRRWEKRGWIQSTKTPGGTRLYDKGQLKKLNPSLKRGPKSFLSPITQTGQDFQSSPISLSSDKPILNTQTGVKIEKYDFTNDFTQNNTKKNFLTLVLGLLALSSLLVPGFLISNHFKNTQNISNITGSPTETLSEKLDKISPELIGQVLAESTPSASFLEINLNTNINGTASISGTLTAPNILYKVIAGENISITGDPQSPTIASTGSNDTLATVTARGSTTSTAVSLTGGATIGNSLNLGQLTSDPSSAVNGATYYNTSSNKFRCYINGSWANCDTDTDTDTNAGGDITAVTVGNGLSGGGSSDAVTIDLDVTTSSTTTTTSSNSGLQAASDGLSLLRGCSNNEVLSWDSTNVIWECNSVAGLGGFTSFTAAGDSGTSQTISDTNTLTLAGGTNGIDTVAGATDTITLNLDTTEIGTTTFGSGSGITWTFDAGATDPTLAFASDQITLGAATAVLSGTTTITASSLATFTTAAALSMTSTTSLGLGAGATITTSSGDLNLNSGDEIVLADTDTLIIGGNAGNVAYNAIADSIASVGSAASDNDLYIEDILEVDGNVSFGDSATDTVTIVGSSALTFSPAGTVVNAPSSTLTITSGIDATDQTLTGLLITTSTNGNTDSGDTILGIDVGNITASSATESALRIGSGWDNDIYFEKGSNVDVRLRVTAASGGDRSATIPSLSADDVFCFATLANCTGAGGGSGVTYTSQTTNALTKFTSTAGQITSSNVVDDGTTVTVAAGINFAMNSGAGTFAQTYTPSGATSTATGATLTPTFGIDATDQTLTGLLISANTNSNSDSGDTLYGINVNAITATSASEHGLVIGNGWDNNLYLNDTTSRVLLADGGTIVVHDGTNTLCTITDSGTTGDLSCTGNITGGSGGTIGYWSRSGSTLSPATANDIVSIATTNTTGADLAITNTGVYTGTGIVNLTANSATTGNLASITGTGMTTGELLNIDSTYAPSNGSDNEALDINLTFTPTASAATFRGLDLNVTEGANALANTDYGIKVTTDNSANTSTGTHTIYGGHFTATGKTAGTTTAVGLYATASGADNNYAGIFDAGNVGIGTTAPTRKLYVSGTGDTRVAIKDTGVSSPWYLGISAQASGYFTISDDSFYRFSIEPTNGNVGIGNGITPDAKLEVVSPQTSGNIFEIDAQSSTTVAASSTALIGANIDLAANYTTSDDDTTGLGVTLDTASDTDATQDDLLGVNITGGTLSASGGSSNPVWTGTLVTLPSTTNTDSSSTGIITRGFNAITAALTQTQAEVLTTSGYDISSAGALVQNTNAGTINWRGINLTLPQITQTTGTVSADGVRVLIPASSAITTGGTMNGINVVAPTTSGPAAGTLTGINIAALTSAGAGTENALTIGSGWDKNIYLNDTTSIVSLADGGSITIQDDSGPNSLCTITDAGTTGNLTCTGNITGSSSGTVGFWSRSSTTLSPATANDIVSIATTNTTGADLAITNTGIYTGTGIFNLTANSATSGDILKLSATACTTCSALIYTGPSGGTAGVTDAAIKLTSDVGNIGTSNGLISSSATFDGTTATGVNLYLTSTDAIAAANTDYGIYNSVTNTGAIDSAITKTSYGNYTSVSSTLGAPTTAGTTTVYGQYITTTATHAGDFGTVNNYGLYIANGTSSTNGNSTKYNLYVDSATGADNNYTAYFGEHVGIGTTSPTDVFNVTQTSTTGRTMGLYRNLAAASTDSSMVLIQQDNASDDQYVLYVLNDGTGAAVYIDNEGTNRGLYTYSNTGATADQALVQFQVQNTAFDQPDLYLLNNGTAESLYINHAGDNNAIEVYNNVGSSVSQPLVYFNADNTGFDQPILHINQDGTGDIFVASDGGSSVVVIADGGNVGIGDATPTEGKLTLVDTSNTVPAFYLANNTATTLGAGANTTGVLDLQSTSLTTGNFLNIEVNGLTTGNGINLSSTSTAGTGGTSDTLLNIARSGANAGATHTAYGIQSSVTNTGTTSVNVGGLFTATGATTNRGVEVAAMTGATSTGLTIGALSGTTADTGISIGAISGSGATGTGISVGNISTTGTANVGLSLGSLTGGTATNYQVSTGTLTSISSTTDYHLNLGATVGAASATFGGINIGAISGAGTQSAGVVIGANSATATTNYGVTVGAISGAGTTNTGINVGAVSGATTNYAIKTAGGSVDITDSSNALASLSLTNNTATTFGNGANTAGVIDLQSTTLSTGNFLNIEVNGLTSGTGLNLTSTGTIASGGELLSLQATGITSGRMLDITSAANTLTTGQLVNISSTATSISGTTTTGSLLNVSETGALTSTFVGNLAYIDWTPGSAPATFPTGDLLRLHIGPNGTTTGNLFNIVDDTSSIFSVSEIALTTSLPANFTAAGDMSIAYDINFTNPTASFIKSAAPITIQPGETFNSSNLTLKTYNFGSVVVDSILTTSAAAASKYAFQISTGDTTTTADTIYGLSSTNALSGAAAKIGYGLYSTVTSSSTTADTLYGVYSAITQSGASTSGTKTQYGMYSAPTTTGANTSTATINIYGSYNALSSTTSTTATLNAYGVYASNTATVTGAGTVNSYGLYAASGTSDGTGTSTKYGVYIEPMASADENIGLCFDCDSSFGTNTAASGIQFGNESTNTQNLQIIRTNGAAAAQFTIQDEAGTDIANGSLTDLSLNLSSADGTQGLCHDGADGSRALQLIADCAADAADFAEYFGSDGSLEAGDVVVLNADAEGILNRNEKFAVKSFVKKSSSAYEQTTIGIISTNPFRDVLGDRTFNPEEHQVPVALTGQVPVKVSTENGPIEKGDYLTSSSTPGVAMKATQTGVMLGRALAPYNSSGIGKVITLINVSYADPANALANMVLDQSGQILTSSHSSSIILDSDLIVNGRQVNGSLDAALLLMADTISSGQDLMSAIQSDELAQASRLETVEEEVASQSAQIAQTSQIAQNAINQTDVLGQAIQTTTSSISSLQQQISDLLLSLGGNSASESATIDDEPLTINDLTPPDILFASDSATLKELKVTNEATFSGVLKSLGETFLGQTTIAGDLSVDGTFSITEGSKINAFPTLYFQSSVLAEKADFFNGLVTIDKTGQIIAKSIKVDQLKLTDQSAGQAILEAGETEVAVFNQLVKSDSLVILTPESATTQTLAVTEKVEESGFIVKISSPTLTDIKFSYLVIGKEESN